MRAAKTVIRHFLLALGVLGAIVLESSGDIVTISNDTPTGSANVANANDFVGLLSQVSPQTQVGGQNVTFNGSLPGGAAFMVNDLVGRDMDASGGGRTWEFLLTLPVDAVPGSGLESIMFSGFAYERNGNQLENDDDLTWELFLNSDATPTLTDTTGGNDFGTHTVDWSSVATGGTVVTQVRVVVTINGFDGGGEWFGTRGLLMADYNAVPEPGGVIFFAGCCAVISYRRRR